MSRTIVVGDIHGCYDELMEMLETVSFGQDDQVVCVGDLVKGSEESLSARALHD